MSDRDLDKFYIPTGIPVVFDKDTKEMVPFLLQVYSDMIIWKDKYTGSKLETLLRNAGVANTEITEVPYLPYKKILYKGWDLHVIDGLSYSATRNFSIGENFIITPSFIKEMTYDVKLPFPLANDEKARIHLTLEAENDKLATSIMSFSKVTDNFNLFDKITVKLRNLDYSYDSNIEKIESYTESKLYVEVSGRIEMEDQTYKELKEGYNNINILPSYVIQKDPPEEEATWFDILD